MRSEPSRMMVFNIFVRKDNYILLYCMDRTRTGTRDARRRDARRRDFGHRSSDIGVRSRAQGYSTESSFAESGETAPPAAPVLILVLGCRVIEAVRIP